MNTPITGRGASLTAIEAPADRRHAERRGRAEEMRHRFSGSRLRGPLIGTLSIVGGLLLWQFSIKWFNVSNFVLASPTEVLHAFRIAINNGTLWTNAKPSLEGFLLGFGICAAVSVPFGLIVGVSRTVRSIAQPWTSAIYATPILALAPLFVVSLGFTLWTKVAVVALSCFFPILINTVSGVRAIDGDLVEVGRAFELSTLETFYRILLPAAIPYIFAGLELAVGRGVIGLVAADLFGAQHGLGLMLVLGAQALDTANIFVAAVTLAVMGVVFTMIIRGIEAKLLKWR